MGRSHPMASTHSAPPQRYAPRCAWLDVELGRRSVSRIPKLLLPGLRVSRELSADRVGGSAVAMGSGGN
jgi:hypothetical protein